MEVGIFTMVMRVTNLSALLYILVLFALVLVQRAKKMTPTSTKTSIIFIYLFTFGLDALVLFLVSFPIFSQYKCFLLQYLVVPWNLTNSLLFFARAIRYLLHKKIQDEQIRVHEQQGNPKLLKWYTFLHTRLLYAVLWMCMIGGYWIILSAVYAKYVGMDVVGGCVAIRRFSRLVWTAFHMVLQLGFCIALACVYWYDRQLLYNCQWKQFFVDRDVSLHKLEMTLIMISGSLNAVIGSAVALLNESMSEYAIDIVYAYIIISHPTIFPGISIVASFAHAKHFNSVMRKYQESKSVIMFDPSIDGFLRLVNNQDTRAMLIKYAKDHFCVEMSDVNEFKMAAPEQRYACALQIYQDYMLHDSDFVVTLPEAEYTGTFATLQQYEANQLQIPVNMFANAEQIVIENALDMYFRFFNSAAFQLYISTKEKDMQHSKQIQEDQMAS